MSKHAVRGEELVQALTEYVVKRDGLKKNQAHRLKLETYCSILQLVEEDGPLFVLHLTPIPLSSGGDS